MTLSFDNTEKAFAHKSNRDLRKAYWLFKTFAYPAVVKYGPSLTNTALNLGLPIKGFIKKTIFHQFCGGETIAESFPAARQLYQKNIGAILDYSVEGEGRGEDFMKAFGELQKVIIEATDKPEYPFAVFKCTGIGMTSMFENVSNYIMTGESTDKRDSLDYQHFRSRFEALCKLAYENHTKLFIDAEESWIQPAIDEIVYNNIAVYNTESAIIYNTIQMYRKGMVEEIAYRIQEARAGGYKLGLKLVRGAYMEKEAERAEEMGYPNPIQNSKEDTDRDYNEALKLCFENRDVVSICAGTHNEESSLLLVELIEEAGLEKNDDRFWFAQLFGMSDHISYNLADAGFNVAKYLPYGPVKEVLPYLSRRAQENTSVKGQAGRELSLINKELKRRKGLQE
jgi:proline dehydrogenase